MQGASGSANIRKIQQLLRSDPPKEIGGRGVVSVNDYWDEVKYGPFLSETDKSSRNLISYTVEGASRQRSDRPVPSRRTSSISSWRPLR